MNKFKFELDSILGLKEKQEEQAKTNYGNAKRRLNEEEAALYALCERRLVYEADLRERMLEKLQLREIHRLEDAISVMKELISHQTLAVKRANRQLEMMRLKLNEAMLERKTYGKLKEKAFDVYKLAYESEERKQVDELISYKHSGIVSAVNSF